MPRILIIEPDKLLAETYRAALDHSGFTVDVAYSGQEAVQLADGHAPDAIVLELQLASQNGVAFLHEFRSYVEWLDIPVILQSTVTPQQDIAPVRSILVKEFGVVAFLYKPSTSLDVLMRTVREAVQAAPVKKA